MVLFLIGAGLGSLDDLTLRGVDALKRCSNIYLESYTSVQEDLSVESLKATFPSAAVIEADRDFVESSCEVMLTQALQTDVAFLVVGDPFGATTHGDLYLRAVERGCEVSVIHNTSIMNAVGCCGLQLYRFGQTVSIPFFDGTWRPSSFVDKIEQNLAANLHTLCLLDIKVKEQSVENMMNNRKIYEPPRFMSVNSALQQIGEVLDAPGRAAGLLTRDTLCCGLARVGSPTQIIKFGSLDELACEEFGKELHCLIVCAPQLHEIESAFARVFVSNRRRV